MEKRILYHHRTQGKGVEGVHIRGMIDGFRRKEYTVDLVEPPGVDVCSEEREIPGDGIKGQKKPGLKPGLLGRLAVFFPQMAFEVMEWLYNVYSYQRLNQRLAGNRYHFIYERYALNSFSTAYLSQKYRKPYILEVNDATVIERSRELCMGKLAEKVEKRVFERANLIVTISNYFKDRITDRHGISADKILVLPNAISPQRFELSPDCCLSKEALGIEGRYVIGCTGAFVSWHGLEFFLSSVHDILKKTDAAVLFIGDGPVRENIERQARRLDIAERVHFTGFMDPRKVPYYIDLLDVFVIPDSNHQGSPMKLFEGMAMAKPLIIPRYQPLEEVITEGYDGCFFKPGDSKELQYLLLDLLSNEEKRHLLGRKARETVLKRHTWERNVEKLLDVIQRYIGLPSGTKYLIDE